MRRWTEDEIEHLKMNYPEGNTKDIAAYVKRTPDDVKHKAKALGIRKTGRRTDITYCDKLLDGSLEANYWIGFILADGHINKGGYRLRVALSSKDRDHLEKLGRYLNVPVNNLKHSTTDLYNPSSEFSYISASGATHLRTLMDQYDISNNKTYNPPDMKGYTLTDEQLMALIVGFIDGDGSISNQTRKLKNNTALNIHVHVHQAWLNNLAFMSSFLIEYCGIASRMRPRLSPARDNMAKLDISNNQIICKMKQFIVENSIPAMERKWDKIPLTMDHYRNYLSCDQIEEVKRLYVPRKEGYSYRGLAKKFGVSPKYIERVIRGT